MSTTSFNNAGNALYWRALQQGGVKIIFLVRLVALARLLSPEIFGLLVIANLAIDVLMQVTNLGIIPALVQRETADEVHYNTAWTIGLIRALLIFGIIVFAAPAVAEGLAEPRATDLIRVLAIEPIIVAAASIKVAALTRNLDFRSLAIIELPKAAVNTLVAIALAKPFGVWSLVAGTLAGSTIYLIMSYWMAPHRPRISFDSNAARSLIHFGQWIFAASIVALVGQFVLRTVIARQLGAIELGLYYLAVSLAFIPADFAEQVVGEVAFPFYARMQNDIKQVAHAFRVILISLSALLLPAYALLLVLAPSLVDTILGPKWQGTAAIIQVLVLANIIGLLGDTIVPILKGTGWPDRLFLSSLAQSGVLVVFVWILAQRYGLIGAAAAWIPAIIASQIVVVLSLLQIIRRPFTNLGPRLLAIACVSATAAILAMIVDSLVGGLIGFIMAIAVGLLVTVTLFWLIERHLKLGLSEGLANAYPKVAALIGLSPDDILQVT